MLLTLQRETVLLYLESTDLTGPLGTGTQKHKNTNPPQEQLCVLLFLL